MKSKYSKYSAFILLLFVLITLNCNRYTYRIIYNNLDYVLYYNIDKYFAPTDKQKEFVKKKLAELLEWHRKTALPRYKEFLISVRDAGKNSLTEEQLNFIYSEINKEILNISEKAAPDSAEFILTLNNEQIENYKKELAKSRKKEDEREKEDTKNPDHRAESTVKFLSSIYGSFSSEQINKIKEYMKNNTYPDYDRREYRDLKQKEFMDLIAKKPDKETMANFLLNWFSEKDAAVNESFMKNHAAERKYNSELYLYIDKNIITAEQHSNAVEAINNWITIIDNLINNK